MSDLISIVLPVYNGERFLEESIESILQQTYSEWELLLLDDCSSDRTPEICSSYETKDSRIHYYRNENNLKLPGNLNKGFSLAKGSLLTWTSDDNRYRPNALERMYSVLKEKQADLVYASCQIMDENGTYGEFVQADPKTIDHIVGSDVVGACFLYTRSAYEEVGDYDTNLILVEDFDYWQRMIACRKAVAIDEILYDYRMHSGSLTSTKKKQEFGKVLETMLKKNVVLYEPLSLEQKRFYYACLRKSYEAQNLGNKGKFRSDLYSLLGRINAKVHRKQRKRNVR